MSSIKQYFDQVFKWCQLKRCLFLGMTCGKFTILVNIAGNRFEYLNLCDNYAVEISKSNLELFSITFAYVGFQNAPG